MMKILTKALLLFLVVLQTASCQTPNPGAYAFVTQNVVNRIKTKYWPDIMAQISTISIPEGFSGSGFSASNVAINLNIDQNSANIVLDESNNSLTPQINGIMLSGTADFSVKYSFFHFSGSLGISGTIDNISATAQLSTATKDNGQIPSISILNSSCSVNQNLDITIHDSVLKILEPIIDHNIFGLKSWLIGQIQSAVTNSSLMQNLSNLGNTELAKVYPTQIPIETFGVSVSTYTTGGIKIWSTGIEIPLEGFTFPTASGYTKYATCGAMSDLINHTDNAHDANAVLGDCLVDSAVNSLADVGVTQKIPINKYGLGEISVGFVKWDQNKVDFHADNLILNAGLKIDATIAGQSIGLTANFSANVGIVKKCGLRHEFWLGVPQKMKNLQKFSGINLDTVLSTYTIQAKITDVTDPKTTGVWPIAMDVLIEILKLQTFGGDVKIPQFCIVDGLCMGSLDMALKEGYLQASASLAA